MTQITSKAVHVSMTDSLRSAIEDAFSPVLDNFESLIVENITVTVDSKDSQATEKATVKARVPVKGNDVMVEVTGDDMYRAIEDAAQKATRLMRKHKERFSKKGGDTIRGHVEVEEDSNES